MRQITARTVAVLLAVVGFLSALSSLSANASGLVQKTNLKAQSQGVSNIVKRAYQMTNLRWTPQTDIVGWAAELTYRQGVTYTGLPYGQPVYAGYVPWTCSLSHFDEAVADSGSKMYTSYSEYNERAPYYSTDCSAFVSWAWQLPSRQTTRSIGNYATEISRTSYEQIEVGDCLCLPGTHVVLVTDLTYDSAGAINAVEISESTVNYATDYCCQRTWYGIGNSQSLSNFYKRYLDNGYILYRSKTRDTVTYTHECCVPLKGDVCSICGYGNAENCSYGIDVSHHQGVIDWAVVAPQIDFAVIRCGYGDDLAEQDDRQWQSNVAGCTAHGIPYGVYLYSYACTDEQAASEAVHAIRLLSGYSPTLPVYLDLEDSSIAAQCSKSEILRHAQIFCTVLENAGYRAGIYANTYWWTTYLTDSAYDQWDRWVASWGASPGYDGAYSIWQFSDSGSISGIAGNVDENYLYGELPQIVHTHSYQLSGETAATCTEAGCQVYTCKTCTESYRVTVPALGHSFQDWAEETAATCTADGTGTRSCTRCSATESRALPALGHRFQSSVHPPTCTQQGYTAYLCERCSSTYNEEFTEPLGHNFANGICARCQASDPDYFIRGDINADGAVTTADAVMLARYLADLQELTQWQLRAADINNDGVVTTADAVQLARHLAGL